MCSNMDLSSQEEAISYIHRMLSEHEAVTIKERTEWEHEAVTIRECTEWGHEAATIKEHTQGEDEGRKTQEKGVQGHKNPRQEAKTQKQASLDSAQLDGVQLEDGKRERKLTEYIKGVHMHQSVTGAYAKARLQEVRENGLYLAEGYYQRFAQVYDLLGKIDTHQPFSSPAVKDLIERINPRYLVHELLARSRSERECMLRQQSGLL